MRLLGVHKDRQRYRAAFDVAGTRRYRSLRSKEMDAAVVEARFAEAYGIDFAGSPPTLADLVTRLIIGLSVKEETREMHWREARQMEALGMTVADACEPGCFIMSGTETPMSPRQATTRAANLLCAWRIDATLKDLREGSSS